MDAPDNAVASATLAYITFANRAMRAQGEQRAVFLAAARAAVDEYARGYAEAKRLGLRDDSIAETIKQCHATLDAIERHDGVVKTPEEAAKAALETYMKSARRAKEAGGEQRARFIATAREALGRYQRILGAAFSRDCVRAKATPQELLERDPDWRGHNDELTAMGLALDMLEGRNVREFYAARDKVLEGRTGRRTSP